MKQSTPHLIWAVVVLVLAFLGVETALVLAGHEAFAEKAAGAAGGVVVLGIMLLLVFG